jgi:molecular chaperone GrpE
MMEETKPVEENHTSPEPEEAAAATPLEPEASAPSQDGEQASESLLDETPESLISDEGTDYQAAFMELRSAYAAKERECESLKTQLEERTNQHLRLAADFENYRRRTQKEKEDLEIQVKCSTVSELLSVVDNFERARSQLKPQTDGETNLHKSYQGIYKDMVDRLKKIGVSPMRAEGQPFDPNFHEAVMREPTADQPEGVVLEELVRGYLLGDKVLRHAMVKVSTAPESATESTAESATEESSS